ncbi:MAG: hypothetical protein R3F55_10555 [Alphaproteobacteria bacterium]
MLIDRLLTELTEDLGRQTAYLGRERDNLRVVSVAILNGEWFGNSLANAAYSATPAGVTAPVGIAASRPLLIIRFTGQSVDYDQALYTAALDVISVRPDAAFELVAVARARHPGRTGAGRLVGAAECGDRAAAVDRIRHPAAARRADRGVEQCGIDKRSAFVHSLGVIHASRVAHRLGRSVARWGQDARNRASGLHTIPGRLGGDRTRGDPHRRAEELRQWCGMLTSARVCR